MPLKKPSRTAWQYSCICCAASINPNSTISYLPLRQSITSMAMQATTFISSLFKHRDPSYELLPASTDHSANDSEFARWHEQSFFGRWSLPSGRALKILAGSAIGFLLFVMFAMGLRKATAPDPYHGLPTYKELFNLENNLPQNNPDLAWPEGKHGYVCWFLNYF